MTQDKEAIKITKTQVMTQYKEGGESGDRSFVYLHRKTQRCHYCICRVYRSHRIFEGSDHNKSSFPTQKPTRNTFLLLEFWYCRCSDHSRHSKDKAQLIETPRLVSSIEYIAQHEKTKESISLRETIIFQFKIYNQGLSIIIYQRLHGASLLMIVRSRSHKKINQPRKLKVFYIANTVVSKEYLLE